MCSVITVADRCSPVLGANYDFYFGHGLIAVTRKGATKFAMSDDPGRLTWHVRHDSITINQFGCELPTGGINDAGLCIHLLECEGADYPPAVAGQPQLIELQWIQYVLDTADSVAEAIDSLQHISLIRTFFGLQFALADATETAFITPAACGFAITRMPPAAGALSNTPWPVAHAHARGETVIGDPDSLRRFMTLRSHACAYTLDGDPIGHVFAGLDLVARRPGTLSRIAMGILGRPRAATVWQTVFIPRERRLVISTLADRRRKTLSLNDVEFSGSTLVKLWNMDDSGVGNLAPLLADYTHAANAALVHKSYRYFTEHVPKADQVRIAAYPGAFVHSVLPELQPA